MKNKKNRKGKVILSISILIVIITIVVFLFVPLFNNLKFGLDLQGGFEILYKVESVDGSDMNKDKLMATYKTLSKRIDSLGVSEPEIILEGNDKIRVKLAGVTDPEQARSQLSTVATLSFRDSEDNLLMTSDVLKAGGAKISQNASGEPAVLLSIKDKEKFYEVTNKISQSDSNMIIIWLDFNEMMDSFEKEGEQCGESGSNCLSRATVSQGFASDVIIDGKFSEEEVSNLVDLINSGSLPSKLTEISSQTVGASFGDDTLYKTLLAGIIGIALIGLFLIFVYHFAGIISTISIIFYTFLVFLVFWIAGGVLTLPGIAALVLGIGMAVDSNVITFERIRDELYKGKGLSLAYKEGSKSSFSAILDSNLTTLLVAIIMFIFGESAIKGFATMTIITVIVTMFTMVFITRCLVKLFVKTDYFNDKLNLFIRVKKKDIPDVSKNESIKRKPFAKINFLKNQRFFLAMSVVLIVVGMISIYFCGLNLGIDYKSGTDITIATDKDLTKKDINSDMKELDLESSNIQISEDEIVIRIDEALDGEKVKEANAYFEDKYEAKVNIGVVSNIVKRELVKNAIISVLIALVGIIVYVSIRFKFSYALAGVIALVHDVMVMIALFGLLQLEVSSMFIAALLAIIGYSINDTIVTFDRIRENLADENKVTKEKITDIANRSLQETLMRTIYTSFTTLIPVVALIFLGSNEILTFNLAMLFGLIAGTYSSIFIAVAIYVAIEKRTFGKTKVKKVYTDDIQEKKIKGINC